MLLSALVRKFGYLLSFEREILRHFIPQNDNACHSEPFAICHSERSEESFVCAQDKLHEESISDAKTTPYPLLRKEGIRGGFIIVAAGFSLRFSSSNGLYDNLTQVTQPEGCGYTNRSI